MSSDEKIIELEEELTKVRWAVIGLCEVRRKRKGLINLQSGHMRYYYGDENVRVGDICFIINKKHKNSIVEINYISQRV